MKAVTLSIIIVSYNTERLTVQTIESVYRDLRQSPELAGRTEIFLVDNDSRDGSTIAVRKQFLNRRASEYAALAKLTIMQNESNVGFARANNQAIAQAKGKFVLLLNSDTVVQRGALQTLVQTFHDNPLRSSGTGLVSARGKLDRLGVVAPLLLNQNLTTQPQGGSFPNLWSVLFHMWMIDDIPLLGQLLPSTQHTGWRSSVGRKPKNLFQQDWVGGTAMMIRREVLDEVGSLDPKIFMYAEDVEYCLRARNHHWDVAIQPSAMVVHYGSASSSSKNAILGELKGYLYIWAKHKPLWQLPLLRFILRVGVFLRWVLFTLLLNQAKARIYAEAPKHMVG